MSIGEGQNHLSIGSIKKDLCIRRRSILIGRDGDVEYLKITYGRFKLGL